MLRAAAAALRRSTAPLRRTASHRMQPRRAQQSDAAAATREARAAASESAAESAAGDGAGGAEPRVSMAVEPTAPAAAESVAATVEMEASTVERLHTGVIWFSHLYPIKLNSLDPRHKLFNMGIVDGLLTRLMDKMDANHATQVIKVVNRAREGGAFVHFRSALQAKETVDLLTAYLRKHHPRSWLTRGEIRSHLVRGRPFVNDMDIYPSRQLRVDFRGEPLEVEELYEALRPYGTINKITMNPVNELPRYAVAYFQHVSGAVSATNCLHNSILHGTKLSISYKPFLKTSRWREWFSSNSRVFLPFLFSLVAALTYAIFDPVRVFFIVNRITGRFDFGHSQRWSAWNSDIEVGEEAGADAELSGSGGASNKGGSVAHAAGLESTAGESTPSSDWLESVKNLGKGMYRTLSRFIISDDEHGLPIWSKESYEKLKRILGVNPFDDVVLLAGASGTGKTSLIHSVLGERPNVLHIDLRHADVVLDSRDVVKQIKRCVGFFPNLSLINTVREMGEQLMAVSSRGILAPTSSSEAEVRHVLKCVTSALKVVHKRDKETPPIVVVNGLNSVFCTDHKAIAQAIVEWADAVTNAHLAHVVVLCDNNVAEDLENRPTVKTTLLTLEDGTLEQSAQLVRERLHNRQAELSDEDLAVGVTALGGRLGDIHEVLVRCQHGRQGFMEAVNDVVHNAASYIESHMLGVGSHQSSDDWSKKQAWTLIKALQNADEISYESMLFSPVFRGDDQALHALQRSGFISIVRRTEPVTITTAAGPGAPPITKQVTQQKLYIRHARPVFREAFARLARDPSLSSGIELLELEEADKKASEDIVTAEAELREVLNLMTVAKQNSEYAVANSLKNRAAALAKEIAEVAEKLHAHMLRREELKAVLAGLVVHDQGRGSP